MMTCMVIRSLLPVLLLLLGFSTSRTYASELLIMSNSGDGSMDPSHCEVSIVHSELTEGVPKLVQDIYDDLYSACVDVGSNGRYKYIIKRYLGDETRNRVLPEQVDDAEEEAGRELVVCSGPCASSAVLTYSQCVLCCTAYNCSWCAGTFASKPCTLRRRLGTPTEAFHEEMRRLGDAASETSVAKQCRSDLRKVTKELNSLGIFCHGNADQIDVIARLP
jgi:hypothetical protein